MYKHILIPTDGSETADKAVEAGIRYAREAGARVTIFTAVPEYEVPSAPDLIARRAVSLEEHERRSKEAAEVVLVPAADKARAIGVEVDTDWAQNDQPYRAIIEAAERHGCDAIFMSSHARSGLAKLWHGSHTVDVLTHTDIPTLIYR